MSAHAERRQDGPFNREIGVAGAGGGALAGVFFGPVGIAVGVVIGGVLGSITADQAYVETTGPREEAVRRFLPRFTHMFHVDEDEMARAMITELGIDLDAVYAVFAELDRSYTSDVDDVALLYVRSIRDENQVAILEGLKLHPDLRQFLIDGLEAGWTNGEERGLVDFLKGLTPKAKE